MPELQDRYLHFSRCITTTETVDACFESLAGQSDSVSWCACDPLYGSVSGKDCKICSENGHVEDGECVCEAEGTRGTACEQPCNGYGHIEDENCMCEFGITGQYCENVCDWMCKGGDCKGKTCNCYQGFFGQWCTDSCFMRQGERVCEQILFPNEPPLRHNSGHRNTSYMVVVIIIYISFLLIGVIIACCLRDLLRRSWKTNQNRHRSRYMKDRPMAGMGGGGMDDSNIENRELIKSDATYESYDDPNYKFSTDHQIDEAQPSHESDSRAMLSTPHRSHHYHPNSNSKNSSKNNNKNVHNAHSRYADDEMEVDLHSEEFRSP